jgi:alpha-amylase
MNSLPVNTTPRRNIVLYFQVHQPQRLGSVRFFDIGAGSTCFDDENNRNIVQRIARECYLPANAVLLKMIRKHPQIRVAFSLSGVIMDQFEEYASEVLESFRELAATGAVELLSETSHHSLACLMPGREFEEQVLLHAEKIYGHFGVRPSIFRNTELIYSDEIGRRVSRLGFTGIMADGLEKVLADRSPNQVFQHPDQNALKILLRNYHLSDDVAFRFTAGGKALTAEKYMSWLNALPHDDQVVNLAMDYETFGEHLKKETGIFKFMQDLLSRLARSKSIEMATPSQAIARSEARSTLHVPQLISWADQERDLSAWLGNDMQRDAYDTLINLECDIKNIDDEAMLEQWRNLQTSDHFYYMSTKKGSDGIVHSYFSPYPSPYEAFINYMNVLTDFSMRVQILKAGKIDHSLSVKMAVDQWPQSMGSRMTMLATH